MASLGRLFTTNEENHITGQTIVQLPSHSAREVELGEYNYGSFPPNEEVRHLIDQVDESRVVRWLSTASSGSGHAAHAHIEDDEVSLLEDMPHKYNRLLYNPRILLNLAMIMLFYTNSRCFRNIVFDHVIFVLKVLVFGRLCSHLAVEHNFFMIERYCLVLRKRVLYCLYGLTNVQIRIFWVSLLLIIWQMVQETEHCMMYGNMVSPYISKIGVCVLVGKVVWFLQNLLIQVLVSNFHITTYFDRIQVSILSQHVLKALSGQPMQEQEVGDQISMMEDKKISVVQLQRMDQQNISSWNMLRMMNVISESMVTFLDEAFVTQITTENQAEYAAMKIFQNVVQNGSEDIYLEDLVWFLGDDKALKKIGLFDTASEMRKISKGAFTNWVVNVLRERRALALSLEDIKSSVDKVHQMLSVLVGFIIFEICLLILELASIRSIAFIVSQLGLIVAFGVTYKKTFDSLYFLFVVHPFDVGDRCEINGEQMIVERMNTLTTDFLQHGNLKTSYENTELSTKSISNYRHSPDMIDSIDFLIRVPPSPELDALLMERITGYIEDKSDYWKPGSKMLLRDAVDTNQIKVSLMVSHRMNFQDMDERLKRRALLVGEMIKIFDGLNIECSIIPVEMNVSNLPALAWNRMPLTWPAY